MPDKRTFDDDAPTPRTLISEAIDYVVDFFVAEETAEARARRRWHMDEKEPQDVH